MSAEVPKYTVDDSGDSDDSVSPITSVISSKEVTVSVDVAEYDDDEVPYKDLRQAFKPIENDNVLLIESSRDTVLVGLKEKQRIFISGVFKLQVVKGGIIYNNIHYNASSEHFNVWHPLCNSIPGIQSSYFAGWEEACHIGGNNKTLVMEDLKDYCCVIRVQNANVNGLNKAGALFPDVKYLWSPRDGARLSFTSDSCTYFFLQEGVDPFTPLLISNEWSNNLESLTVAHKSSLYDTRMMVIGGKNSGKSTFVRLLLENFLYNGERQTVDDEILYLDLDPGQPEYSHPDCISLSRITRTSNILGGHLGQPYFKILRQCYVGSSSPQEVPNLYLTYVDELIHKLEGLDHMGTSLVNLPGWIKGFGLNIMNHIISRYKPTHIILLESKGTRRHLNELNLDLTFESQARSEYSPIVSNIAGVSSNPDELRFQAHQIRTFKTLSYFHATEKTEYGLEYEFSPLLNKPPFQISYGSSGLQGIQFPEEFAGLHEDDIKTALEGTIVGLFCCKQKLEGPIIDKNSFPIIQQQQQQETLYFTSLVLIHSIDVKNKYMNVFIPLFNFEKIKNNPHQKWVIVRGRSEAPLSELYPIGNPFNGERIPYISVEQRKKHEHVWKVRKNVMRRGHHLK